MQLQAVEFHLLLLLLLLRGQTVMRKSFHGAASATKMPLFVVTPVMETYTATAASGSHISLCIITFLSLWLSFCMDICKICGTNRDRLP